MTSPRTRVLAPAITQPVRAAAGVAAVELDPQEQYAQPSQQAIDDESLPRRDRAVDVASPSPES